jgi:hypothetical protein
MPLRPRPTVSEESPKTPSGLKRQRSGRIGGIKAGRPYTDELDPLRKRCVLSPLTTVGSAGQLKAHPLPPVARPLSHGSQSLIHPGAEPWFIHYPCKRALVIGHRLASGSAVAALPAAEAPTR